MSGVVIIDAGGANLGSVRGAFARLGIEPEVSCDPARIAVAERLVLPGVGAASPVMRNLLDSGIDAVLRASSKPLLGICIGMQVLFEHSEEGDVAGLGLLRGEVRKLPASAGARLPHMGWNQLGKRAASPLLDGIEDGAQAYFVHSYGVTGSSDAILEAEHGGAFAAAVARANIAGAQFHPERSGVVGARFLQNFLAWQPA
ncbi:imidazole glycerol phosphate synthase subunit HisH [Thermomonas sp. HDW16]|uniref:imidazole glycerol phosphate synthase subunit HisH n=1 Tax=Thermomonas sp. HDW16 TaxID=2714945 RepID=UPI00140A0AEB|nr:imidazole glycerol phosphate synthase subunit HisH [Thermomonas sp. HDW16]QIL20942.1 imidazole glycerol phosphate synthase subunit HisH [Thermomonas sp. HDW16]